MTLYEFLKTHNNRENHNLGMEFGKFLYNIHNEEPDSKIDCYENFNTKANYLFYMHGVSEYIGDDDYILIDYINHNKHLTKNLETSPIIGKVNIKNLDISVDNQFLIKSNEIGDSSFDFVNINEAALVSSDFANGVIDSYFCNRKIPIKFYRLLSLYQAYLILDSMVTFRNGKQADISNDEIKELLEMYDHFNQYVPTWIGAVAK
ncbi:kanamycin kinase [uncultured Anaerococcus sp.]|uniref:kanamycin kinase n=1 Tax=uncultured Anaerococcus sp. TaxID=293428 RepID=UPI002630603E|nr:kanamycin kinase [uncultured Anaerococcus sp.]